MGKNYDFDVAVIGGGPAGYVAAIRAAQLGARAALIEKSHLGGVCTNAGCIPTKVLIHAASLLLQLEHGEKFGIHAGDVRLDFKQLAARRDEVVARLRKGVESLLKLNKVELLRARASFEDDHTLSLSLGGKREKLTAQRIMIASGSGPVGLPAAPFDGERVIDSTGAVNMESLPESLLIVGAGYIGCEFAGAFSALGVQVTVVELLERIMPEMDADCSREVARLLKKRGAKILTSTSIEKLDRKKDAVTALLSSGEQVTARKAIICVGRRPNSDRLGLENAGVKTGERGEVTVNEHMQTSRPHIYAIGDVTGGIMLAHVASREATVAAAHATGALTARMDYRVVPACAFTFPEIASVGMTEQEAKGQVGEVIVKKFPMRALGRAHVEGRTEGFVKIIADGRTREVLGVHIACERASSLIAEAALGMELEVTAEELARTIHAHPTMPESLREAAEGILGLPVNWAG